ncbi:hypothetical protein RRG08_028228 [Elysia crispata]|uniref:Uncharacterized protein n=1 Tax=Elysia crispata TaxID=231223 RepID=A0AAE1E4R9_9GAST|nr:hypothetical protein RRG08_028228 [Elysia crispata]
MRLSSFSACCRVSTFHGGISNSRGFSKVSSSSPVASGLLLTTVRLTLPHALMLDHRNHCAQIASRLASSSVPAFRQLECSFTKEVYTGKKNDYHELKVKDNGVGIIFANDI